MDSIAAQVLQCSIVDVCILASGARRWTRLDSFLLTILLTHATGFVTVLKPLSSLLLLFRKRSDSWGGISWAHGCFIFNGLHDPLSICRGPIGLPAMFPLTTNYALSRLWMHSWAQARQLVPGAVCWIAIPCATWVYMSLACKQLQEILSSLGSSSTCLS